MPRLFNRKDIILIAVIVLIAAAMLALQSRARGKTAIITVNSKSVAEVDLSTDRIFTVTQADGFEFEVKDGAIAVIKAPCPDKLCESCGFISRSGQAVVCLPYKLVVSIEGKSEFDAAVG